MKEKLAKIIRVVTVAPIAAFAVLTLLLRNAPGIYAAPFHYWYALGCLSFFPLLAYPVSWIAKTGRKKQRMLAVYFSLVGYAALLGLCIAAKVTSPELSLYITYIGSVVVIAATSRFPKLLASGHACGVAGPAVALCLMLGWGYWPALLVLPLVYWSSLVLRRHTWSQLLLGTATPVLFLCCFHLAGMV
ncbi:MAG: hypothetical protein VB055_01695 [Oscillospiraceae bacterium]|nr:hypothetical protein [Oscillospiraceae bacterium]